MHILLLLCRVVSLIDFGLLTPDTKILTWGKAYEAQYLLVMGIQPNQIVSFDPERVYCANTLLVPTPVPRITPPREALLAVRRALRIQTLPEVGPLLSCLIPNISTVYAAAAFYIYLLLYLI